MEKSPDNFGKGGWGPEEPTDFKKLAKEKPESPEKPSDKETIASIDKHSGIENKESAETEKQPEKPPEKPLKNIKTQVYDLIDGARVVFDSKELDPVEKKELLNQYSFQLAKLLNIPFESAYLPELINDDVKLDQLIDKLSTEEGKELSEKNDKDNQELDKIIKEVMEEKITFESIMKFMTNPEKYMDSLKQRIQDPDFQKNLKNNPDKIKGLMDKFNDFINKEKQKSTPEAIKEAAKTIENEEEKGKESIFQKMKGWHTVGEMARSSLIIFLILIFLGEFKLLEKATGFDLEGDKKRK